VADGEELEGRPIAPEAYAAYLHASVLEARGDTRGAMAELERALDEDPSSPEIVTRIAELWCKSGSTSAEAAEEAKGSFEDALGLDPTYSPAWLGLAECLERRHELKPALHAAEQAATFDPTSPRATRTVARLLFALGRPTEAFTWLDALLTLSPGSREAGQALLEQAVIHRDRARERRARTLLVEAGSADRPSLELELEQALGSGDLARMRELATSLSIRPDALSLRALDVSPKVALEQAELVLAADPSAADAWIAALCATDELGDEDRFESTLRLLDPEPLAPSPAGRAVFERLVARRAGADAAPPPPQRKP
jgi:tetratricopeptide (TPR) repeat protein